MLGRTLKPKFFRENLFKRKIYSYLFVGNIGRSSIWMMERIFCSFWLLLNLKILQGTHSLGINLKLLTVDALVQIAVLHVLEDQHELLLIKSMI